MSQDSRAVFGGLPVGSCRHVGDHGAGVLTHDYQTVSTHH